MPRRTSPEVRWNESFTLTLYATRIPGRERLVIVFGYCAGSLCWCSRNRPTCTLSWPSESVEDLTPCWTRPSVTTTAGGCAIAIIMGSANRHRPTRTEHFFCFLQTAYASRANPRNNASGCIVCFHTIPCRPLLPGVLPC